MCFSFYETALLFFVYGFIGWCVEVAFVAVTVGTVENRGFLNGPICPIYGCGMWGVLTLLLPIKKHWILLFFGGMLICTAIELFGGWLLDRIFHMRWWDYTNKPFNIGGYVCLQFAILWGLAVTFAVELVHPPIMSLIRRMPMTLGRVLIVVFIVIFIVDMVVTLKNLFGIKKSLGQLERVAGELQALGDQLKEVVGNSAIMVAEKAGEGIEKVEAREKLESVTEATKEKIGSMSDATREKLGSMSDATKEKIGNISDATKEKWGDMSEATRQKFTEQMAEMEAKKTALIEKIQRYSKHIWNVLPKLNKSGNSINIKEYMNTFKRK